MNDKKLLRIFLKIIICFILCAWALVAALHFTLAYVASLPGTKEKIISSVKEQLNADVNIGSISAGIYALKVNDVSLSVEGKNIADSDFIYVRFSLIHLIKGHLRINNIIINKFDLTVIKDKDGKFNFEPILQAPAFTGEPEPQEQKKDDEEDDDVFDILIQKINFNDFCIKYIDEREETSFVVNRLTFVTDNFGLEKPFDTSVYSNVSVKNKDVSVEDLNVFIASTINLNSLKMNEAEIAINNFILRLENTVVVSTGTVSNFENPKINLNTKISNLSSETFKNIADIPKFLIPEININTLLNVNLNESLLNIEKFSVNVLDCSVDADGKINYSDELKYDINVIINLILDKITQVAELTKDYKATGIIGSKLNITNEASIISGNLSLINVAAFLEQFGNITDVNSDITIKSIDDINMPSLTGKINSYPFVGSASYVADDKKGKLKANFFADRIYGKMSKEYEEKQKKAEEQQKNETQPKEQTDEEKDKILKDFNEQQVKQEIDENKNISSQTEQNSSFKPIDVEVYFKVNHINVPYFLGKDIKFKMDMLNVTPELDKLEGILSLTTADGTIKDIYKLTESNVLIKGMFLSLRIVSNVVNALNVLDILNSIGSAVISSSKDNENISVMSAEDSENRKQKSDGQIDFLSFITAMNFKNGKGVFKNCSFVSNLMSFKVAGNIDFKENLVDMAVNAAPGRHEEKEGIMPLKMKITGTTDEPNGSLSVLGSVSTLVGDALTKNVVSGSLKSGFSKLLGLKKYDENGNDIQEEENTKKKKEKKKKKK